VHRRLRAGEVLAGDALTRWRAHPGGASSAELLDALVDSLAELLRCAAAAADERVRDAWAREPAAGRFAGAVRHEDPEDRIGLAVRRWRRVLEELAEEEVREMERSLAPDPETVAALLAAALLGGKRARRAGERLAERIGAQGALRLRDKGGELIATYIDQVLGAERERRLAPLDELEVTPEPQAGLIAALSVVQRERRAA
jgi:hypothetical protein